jgi:hypothetical protein
MSIVCSNETFAFRDEFSQFNKRYGLDSRVFNIAVLFAALFSANYAKNGITGNEVGTDVTITGNTVSGRGPDIPPTDAANNGIQIGFGATDSITGNTAIDDIWPPDTIDDPGDAAAGILVYAASNIQVRNNSVGNTQFGIAVATDRDSGRANGNPVAGNEIIATHIFDGISAATTTPLPTTRLMRATNRVCICIAAAAIPMASPAIATQWART